MVTVMGGDIDKKAHVSEWYYMPLGRLGTTELQVVKHELTTCVSPYQFKGNEVIEPVKIKNFTLSKKGFIGVPIDWGFGYFKGIEPEDRTVLGDKVGLSARQRPDPNHPKAAKGQAEFMAKLADRLSENFTCLAQASTGAGKTVCALDAAVDFGRTTLVIVNRERLGQQWVEEAKLHLGLKPEEMGWIQGDKCNFIGKQFCVAILQTLARRKFQQEFYDYFGMVIWDECHILGAETFAKSLGLFRAAYRLGLTATPTRRDKAHPIFLQYFGMGQVTHMEESAPVTVKVIDYRKNLPEKFDKWSPATQLKILCGDRKRNSVLTNQICQLYNDDRNILVIGDRIEHLFKLGEECVTLRGIPEECIGYFTGQIIEDGKRKKTKAEYLEQVKKSSKVIFATYGMMKQGIDIPRLDAGIDVTPRTEAKQVVGRIRRPLPDKREGIWITINDISSYVLRARTKARIREYKQCKCKVVQNG